MKFYSIILFSFYVKLLYSQSFPTFYFNEDIVNQAHVYELQNKEILIHRFKLNTTTNSVTTELMLLNIIGEKLNTMEFDNVIDYIHYYNRDSIHLVFTGYDSINNYVLHSEVLNKQFESIIEDTIHMNLKHNILSKVMVQKCPDKSYYSFGSYNEANPFDSELAVGSINNNGLFNKDQNKFDIDGWGAFDMAISYPNENENQREIFLFNQFARVAVISPDYHFFDEFTLPNSDPVAGYDAFWSNNNTLIIGGISFYYDFTISEITTSGQNVNSITIEKPDTYDQPGNFSNIAKTDSGFYFLGTIDYNVSEWPFPSGTSSLYLAKFSDDFEIVWEKEWGNDAFYIAFSIAPTLEGGCLVLATRYNEDEGKNYDEIWLYKFDKNGDLSTETRIDEHINEELLYPNPGNEYFTLSLPEISNSAKLLMYNMKGELVLKRQLTKTQTTINTSMLPHGLYFYKIISNNKHISNGKWMKQ